MSQYHDIQTEIRDQEALVLALQRVQFRGRQNTITEPGRLSKAQIESHETAQNLYGYKGDKRNDVAHVIVRRMWVGHMSNDLGFVKQKDGRFKAIISEYDQNRLGYSSQWLAKVNTYYGVECAKKEATLKGYKVTEDLDEKNRPRLRIKVGGGSYGDGGGSYVA